MAKGAMTDNHGYETPEKGATEWHESLNRNFRYIDRDVEIRDFDAERDNYRPKSGAKFLATDTENVYVGDGNQWLQLSTSGQNPLFDTVSTKTIVDRNSGNGYSVDELAGGDGSGGVKPPGDAIVTLEGGTPTAYRVNGSQIAQDSDAGSVMNTVMTELQNTQGGGRVHVDEGVYPNETRIEVPSNTAVVGSGRGVTVFRAQAVDAGWGPGDDPVHNALISDLTVDGNLAGGATGISLVKSIDSLIQNVGVLQPGGTDEAPNTNPGLRVTRGLRSNIVNCHVEGSNSVSIEAAITAENCYIIGCSITKGRREGDGGFLHGYSIEKSKSCGIIGCTADSTRGGDAFRPALNFNNADNAIVANNVVRGASGGAFNVNGDCYNNALVGNVIESPDKIVRIGAGNAGEPHNTLIADNVFIGTTDGAEVEIGATDSIVRNNSIRRAQLYIRSPSTQPSIVGNHFSGNDGAEVQPLYIQRAGDENPLLFANNFFASESTTAHTVPAAGFSSDYAIITGNVFGTTNGDAKPTVNLNGDRYVVTNNYFRSPNSSAALSASGGVIMHNTLHGSGYIDASSSSTPPVVKNNTYTNSKPFIKGDPSDYTVGQPRAGKYTGDGTTGRLIKTFLNADHVIVEDGSGTLYDVHAQFGTGFEYNAPSGELSLSDGGFTVGDDGTDTDPNSQDETYTFYAQ